VTPMLRERWDVFCRVVDNYGDAGVCWRLARELVAEHGCDVTLRIDRLATLARFVPGIDVQARAQTRTGVRVQLLDDAARPDRLPDVTVEGFGCGLPEAYVDAMAGADRPPLWINLEYLSAEPWVDSVHGLASPHPRYALERYFWFPGFTPRTGGLLREAQLLRERAAFDGRRTKGDALRVTLFTYANRALPALFDAWAEGDERIACAIPEGVATGALDQRLRGALPHPGETVVQGALELRVLPFVPQDEFDRVLWAADCNFVRGEDSFVRAQWAARPFVWQPYPQDEDAHALKLEAFLARYAADLSDDARLAVSDFWRAFNGEDGGGVVASWPAFREALGLLGAHGERWCRTLADLPELAAGMVAFARGRL